MAVTGGLQGLNFTARIGTSQLQNDGRLVKTIFRGIGEDVRKMGNNAQADIDKIGTSIAKIGAAYLSLDFAGRITKEIISVRGEFQQLGIAFETMLGSKEKSDQLMTQQIALAQKTPFTLVDVATNTKQLLAMGIAYEDVMGTMKSLGDVAAGVSVPLSRIAINYGQVATLGKLQQREIRDFAMAGIPLIDELAKNLGKAKDEISGMVEAGQIGFKDVEKAFQTMAGEGGKFYNLMEKQNASVTGQVSNLTDKWQVMLNELGKSNEGAIYSGISGLSTLIENYQAVIDALKVLVVSYGAYKASLIAISAYESAMSKIEATRATIIAEKVAAIKMGIAAEEKEAAMKAINAAREQAEAKATLQAESLRQGAAAKTTAAREAAAVATSELIAAEKAYAISIAQTDAAYSTGAVTEKAIIAQKKELAVVEGLRTKTNKANAALNKAITSETALNANIEAAAVEKAEFQKALAKKAGIKLDQERLIASQKATAAEIRAAAGGGIWKTLTTGANPYLIAIIGITALISALSSLSKETEELAKVSTDFTKSLGEQTDEVKKNFKAITDSKDGTLERAKAIQTVNEKYKDYLPNLVTEKDNLDKIRVAQDLVTASLAKSLAFKAQENSLSSLKTNVDEQLTTFYAQIDTASKKLNDSQKGQFKAQLEQYKQQVADTYKALGYFPKNVSTGIGDIFSKISGLSFGKGIGGWNISGLELSIKDLILGETELDQKTSGLKKTYESYLEALGLTDKSTGASNEDLKTVQKRIEETTAAIVEAEEQLKEMRKPNSVSTKQDIEDKETSIKDLKSTLEVLTGIKAKEAKKQNDEAEKLLKAQLDYETEIGRQRISNQIEIEQTILNTQKDSAEKQRQQADLDFRKTLIDIANGKADQLKKLNEANGGIDLKTGEKTDKYISVLPAEDQKQIDAKVIAAEDLKNFKITEINQNAAETIKKIWQEVSDYRLKGIDKEKAAVKAHYDELEKDAKKAGDAAALAAIPKLRKNANEEVDRKFALQEIDFAEKIETQKNEIAAKGFDRRSNLEKLNFETFKKYALQKIEILNKSGDPEDAKKAKLLEGEISIADLKRKKDIQQQILDGAMQFTNELIDQLGLSEKQTKQMKETAGIISSAASGNWIGAVFQAASMVIGTLKEETVSFLDITNEQISKTNDLLSLHDKILSGLTGNDYIKASAAELAKINLDLDSYNKQLSEIKVFDARRPHGQIDTSNWDSTAWLNAFDNSNIDINGGKEATAAILAQIADLKAKKAALIDEMYQTILGFGASDVSDSIFQGIEDGLKLGENSLGGFAQSFGDLMKDALMQAITDSTNTDITTNFLPKVKEFLQNDEVGPNGEKISQREQLILEGIYSSIVKSGEENSAAVKLVTDKYSSDTSNVNVSQMTGAVKGLTEDTGSLIAGQLMAGRVDMKDMLAAVTSHGMSLNGMNISLNEIKGTLSESNNYLFASLNVLKSIDSNTGQTTAVLKEMKPLMEKTNQLLTNGL